MAKQRHQIHLVQFVGLVHWKKKKTSRPPNSQSSIPLCIIQYKYFFYFIFTHKSENFSQFYFSANLRSLFHFIPIYVLIPQDIVTNLYDIFFFKKCKWQDCNSYDKIRVTRQDHSVMRLAGFERQISPRLSSRKNNSPFIIIERFRLLLAAAFIIIESFWLGAACFLRMTYHPN